MTKFHSGRYGLVITVFILCKIAAAAVPSAFIVCAFTGDVLYTTCENAEKKLRSAGYEVHRLDGPLFKNRAPFEQALRTAEKPLVVVTGHGAVGEGGFHKLYLGKDGGAKSYPTHVILEGLRKVNPQAQIFVESCQAGQVLKEDPAPQGPVGVASRPDEYSPAWEIAGAEGKWRSAVSDSIYELLNLPARDFKYWSGGKCEIGGEQLREYVFHKLNGGTTKLECWLRAFEKGKPREPTTVRAEEELCEKKVVELQRAPGVQARIVEEYQFRVQCTGFRPGEKLRVSGEYLSREALAQILAKPKSPLAPIELKSRGLGIPSSFFAHDLAGRGCSLEPGFYSKRYTALVSFRASRAGQTTYVYDPAKLDDRTLAEVTPFLANWKESLPLSPKQEEEQSRPQVRVLGTPGGIEPKPAITTPDFGPLVFRHARCFEEGAYQPRLPVGAGLSFREHSGDVP